MITRNTKALAYYPADGGIRIAQVPVPALDADEALVRITRVSISRRDHLMLRSRSVILPEGDEYIIPGHIAVGKVVEIGTLVRDIAPGDIVVPTIRRDCDRCIDARSDLCPHPDRYRDSGLLGAHGFARELVVVKARYLVRIPEELEDIGLLIAPLSVAEKAHSETVQVTKRFNFYCYHDAEDPTPRALVTGMGPLGMMTVFLLSLYSYQLAVFGRRETDDDRVAVFRELGVDYINTARVPVERLEKAGYSFRQIFETTGDPDLIFHAIPFMGPNAVLVLMGLSERKADEDTWNVPAGKIFSRMVMGNQVLLGSIKAGRDAFESAVSHLQELDYSHGEKLRRMLTHTYPFEEYHKLLTLESREAILPSLDLT